VADELVVERSVLTAYAEAWDLAARRAEVIRQRVGHRGIGQAATPDAATAELGV
jgi:hypothetical protein